MKPLFVSVCARCGRTLDKPAAVYNGQPVGPKCFFKMHGKAETKRKTAVVWNPENQIDLLEELEKEAENL